MKIAHISDLHLSKITFHPKQFLSKRWVGNINVILSRKKTFKEAQLLLLAEIFEKENIDYLFITGDISSTSQKKEFEGAKTILKSFKNLKIIAVPGNHDHYTKKAHKNKTFYDYFSFSGIKNLEKEKTLKKDGVQAFFLKDSLWAIGLDTALATPLISSKGYFSKKIEENLLDILEKIPKDNYIIIFNHFPFQSSEGRLKKLTRGNILEKILKNFPNIILFLHGHTHKHSIRDLRDLHLPIVVDSGSASHTKLGRWNLLQIEKKKIKISVYHWKHQSWEKGAQKSYDLV